MTEHLGVATASEIDIDTLAGRLRDAAIEHELTLVSPSVVGTWCRIAG